MISVTLLSSYTYCARKLFIERVLGIRAEIPKEPLIKGSIRHAIYEKINLSEEELVKSITKSDFDSIFEIYKNKYLKILKKTIVLNKEKLRSIEIPLQDFFTQVKPLISNEAEHRAGRIHKFSSETGFVGEELWLNLTPKIKAEYMISSKSLGLRGIIDELEVHNNFFVPVELKTGKAPEEGVWPGHKIQAAAYALILEEEFQTQIKHALVRYLDTNITREVIINPFLKKEVRELIKKVTELLDSDKIPDFVENENKCKACDLKDVCFGSDELEEKLKVKTKDLNRT